MSLITRETGTYSKGSTLTFAEMDNNLIYLQGLTRLDLIPAIDNTYTLGTSASRWKSISVGPGTIGITDQTLLTETSLTVNNGVLLVNGANQLQVGQLKFIDNTIESTTGAIDIQIGLTSSSADLKLNRNVVLATGKTLTFADGTTQSTAAGIIQQHTPTSATDSYGVTGSLVRDDENIYVRTNGYGWRPIPFNNSYGSFYDTTNQANPTASIARAININSTTTASNVSIVSSNRITVAHDGIYNIQFSLQLIKTTANNGDADIWLRYNGVDVPNSNTVVTIIDGSKGSNKGVAAWNFVQAMTASSYCQIYWSAADTGLSIYAIGTQSSPTRPATPSIIVTVDKISSLTRI
jgi:hypothetical protein